jgi:hypothetical protein
MGERGKAKGGAVVGRPETRVDGYLSPQEKKLVLQVSKARDVVGCKGLGWVRYCVPCKYCSM